MSPVVLSLWSRFEPFAVTRCGRMLSNAIFNPANQPSEHPRDFLETSFELSVIGVGELSAATGEFQQRDAFLERAAGDGEEVAAVGWREATVPLGKVGTDGEGGSVELVGEKAEAAIEAGSELADFVGEVEGFLIDE